MSVDFEDRLRAELDADQVTIPLDEDAVLARGRASVRNRRVGWALAGVAALAVAVMAVPGLVSRSTTGVIAPVASPTAGVGSGATVPLPKEILGSTTWRLSAETGEWVGTAPEITLVADGDEIVGNLGCGTYTGQIPLRGADWTFEASVAASHSCPYQTNARDTRYLETLNGVTSYEFASDPDRLSLEGSRGTLVFEPISADGVTWQVIRLDGQDVEGSGLTLVVDGGDAHGSTVCVDFVANVARDGTKWSVTNRQNVRGTEVPCPLETSNRMNRYFDLLDQVTRATLTPENLILTGSDGSLEFGRKG